MGSAALLDRSPSRRSSQRPREIYPISRSIIGDGRRITLDHLVRHIDLEIDEVPLGTQVFD